MNTTFKSYIKKDGSRMLYINRSNGVSVGLTADRDFAPYGKGVTAGMRNAMDAARKAILTNGRPFTGDIAAHAETGQCAPLALSNGWVMVGTDVGTIGGMPVGSDGGFLIANGLIVKMGAAMAEESGE
jgi:hypothetical protein